MLNDTKHEVLHGILGTQIDRGDGQQGHRVVT
jgi:hypothetical protein